MESGRNWNAFPQTLSFCFFPILTMLSHSVHGLALMFDSHGYEAAESINSWFIDFLSRASPVLALWQRNADGRRADLEFFILTPFVSPLPPSFSAHASQWPRENKDTTWKLPQVSVTLSTHFPYQWFSKGGLRTCTNIIALLDADLVRDAEMQVLRPTPGLWNQKPWASAQQSPC